MTGFAIENGSAPASGGRLNIARFDWIIAAAGLALVIALQFPLVWQRSIHWDEFFHYSQLQAFVDGSLSSPLQSLQARLFASVLDMPGNGIDHIIIIRFAMFAFELAAAAAIGAIAARFTDRITGVLCAMAYIGGGFVFQHGFSFRTDPMAAALLMTSLWLLLCTRLRLYQILICGFLIGFATMVTIKTILFAPAFAGIAWLRWNEEQRSPDWLYRLAAIGTVSILSFGSIYVLHIQGLAAESAEAARGVVQASATKMFSFGSVPYLLYALKQALLAPALAAVIVLFPGELLRSRFSLHERIALAGLFAPLLTLLFYHNTAPYYYTFMLPPVVAASAIVIARFRAKFGTALIAGLFAFTTLMLWSKESSAPINNQRILVAAAERMFPQGVNYFDFCGFLGGFTKANTFMTPWGVELYKSGFYPSIREVLNSKTVPLVMDNDPMFTRLLSADEPAPEFLPEDAAVIRATYIHLWGPYWIAGKEVGAAEQAQQFDVLVPGPYTVQGAGLTIDGKFYSPGGIAVLDRGGHQIGPSNGRSKLVWGQNITPPGQPAPTEPFWTPF